MKSFIYYNNFIIMLLDIIEFILYNNSYDGCSGLLKKIKYHKKLYSFLQ